MNLEILGALIQKKEKYYLRSIINQKPTHIIYTDQNLNNEIDF